MTGQDHPHHGRIDIPDFLEKCKAIHGRHEVVGDDKVDFVFAQYVERFLRALSEEDLVRLFPERSPQGVQNIDLVVDEKNRSFVGHAAPPG